MASDAHCHPYELSLYDPIQEAQRRSLNIMACASAWRSPEARYHEQLAQAAQQAGEARLVLSYGLHPQLPFYLQTAQTERAVDCLPLKSRGLEQVEAWAASGRLAAIGEIGLDFYNAAYRASADLQLSLFQAQLAIARQYRLPVVIHIRRAMAVVFSLIQELKALPAVIFHCYSGGHGETQSLRRSGVAAFFSFGTPLLLNHKRAMTVCAKLELDWLLFESDAPFQPRRGRPWTSWSDLGAVIKAAAELRAEAGTKATTVAELEAASDANFRRAYGLDERF